MQHKNQSQSKNNTQKGKNKNESTNSRTGLLNAQNKFIEKYFNPNYLNFDELDTRTMKAPIIVKENFLNALNFDIKSLSIYCLNNFQKK